MRSFNYEKQWNDLMTPEIVSLLTSIHEFKGQQALFMESKSDTLTQLMEVAKIQSTDASNRIEGIHTSNDRLKKIVMDKTMPKTRNEREIAGYRDVLTTIHESYDYLPVKSSIMLQIHRDLYKFAGSSIGGNFKVGDNIIGEYDDEGNETVRFKPVSAWETPSAIDELCKAYEKTIHNTTMDPLLVIPMFILDFLCIHPFSDGNGRMSRLLTLLLLYRNDYIVGKYISIEKLINDSKDTYYETLQKSSAGWHEENNDYKPFLEYLLGVIVAAYREFASRVFILSSSGMSKPERIREVIKNHLGKITKSEIMERCPDISQTTVQRTLKDLQNSNEIIKIGDGRYTTCVWNRENE